MCSAVPAAPRSAACSGVEPLDRRCSGCTCWVWCALERGADTPGLAAVAVACWEGVVSCTYASASAAAAWPSSAASSGSVAAGACV